MALKVCMFVRNNCKYDSRVLREAKGLTDAGYDVRIIAVLDNMAEPYEEQDGFRIFRVRKDPLHYRIILAARRFSLSIVARPIVNLVIKAGCRPFKLIFGLLSRYLGGAKHGKAINKVSGTIKGIYISILRKLKSLLMNVHRCLCHLDYYCRSFRLALKERADIYHAHDLNALPVAFWAKRRVKGKLVYDSHELFLDRNTPIKQSKLSRWLISRLESFFIKSVDDVITVSESIGQKLKERYPVKRLSVILNAPSRKVVNSPFSLRDEFGIPQSDRIIIYVGNVTYNRGLEALIQSLAYLQSCVVVIMGRASKAEYKEGLIQLAGNLGVGSAVYFLGPVPREEVVGYASSANVGAIPIKNACLSYYYCLPNKLFECIVAGLPAVGSNFPEIKKVIEGYDLGKTFNPEDPKDIAEAISCVLSDEDRYNRMKANALKAAGIFNWENESKKLVEIYKRLENEIGIGTA